MKISKSMPRLSAVAAAAALSAVAAVTVGVVPAVAASSSSSSSGAAGLSCSKTLKIAIVTPLTGAAAFLGQEQLSWAKYAVKTLAPQYGLKIQLLQGDTPVEQGPAPAQTLAQKYVADPSVVGIVGPSTSGAVAASSSTYNSAGIVEISPSATRTDLTKGSPREASASFFRVVGSDEQQGPADANYMIKLGAKNVVVLDFQEPYSLGLSAAVEQTLKAAGVTVEHQSLANTVTDYSSYVTNVPNSADFVFVPTQSPATAQAFATQLAEQGKKAKVFGGDGSDGVGQYKAAGNYLSNFGPDISGIAADKAIIAGWQKANPKSTLGSFGPSSYGATQILLKAIKLACTAGHGTIPKRSAVITDMRKVTVQNWINGGSFKWSKINTQDPANAHFYIMQIQSNGHYKVVN